VSDENSRIEFFANDKIIEIRYFDDLAALTINPECNRSLDTPNDQHYRSWKLPEAIAEELIVWWVRSIKDKQIVFPLEKKSKSCHFTMYTEKYIEIKSLDCRGRMDMTGWNLPTVVIEKLIVWQKDTADKYKQSLS